ncbi:MAG TPA: NTP transferase domain-containing protein [Fimbriiglobus sp.]|jgi:NDP-sugar pyrophosphorylase family protein
MQLVVPMAGLGKRFADAGYGVPKPLIPVGGVPMVVRAVNDLPPASRTVFVVHPEHVARFGIDRRLRGFFPGCGVVVAPGLTQGQACSVRLAQTKLDDAEDVLVTACDNTHVYDPAAFARLTTTPSVACAIWTYRHDAKVLVKPTAHGWVKADASGRVERVSVKVPLSDTPTHDHAVTGTFWFRSASCLAAGIDDLIRRDERVNGEFYLDSVPNLLIEAGRDVRVFEADKYIGWGTPHDLDEYRGWERYFAARAAG